MSTVDNSQNMQGYSKLWRRILTSTIWQENKETKIVWITMLALKDRSQHVWGTIPGLANIAGVSVNECRSAIAALCAPDPDSSSQELGGARIAPVEGGWFLINGDKYDGLL